MPAASVDFWSSTAFTSGRHIRLAKRPSWNRERTVRLPDRVGDLLGPLRRQRLLGPHRRRENRWPRCRAARQAPPGRDRRREGHRARGASRGRVALYAALGMKPVVIGREIDTFASPAARSCYSTTSCTNWDPRPPQPPVRAAREPTRLEFGLHRGAGAVLPGA